MRPFDLFRNQDFDATSGEGYNLNRVL